MTKVSKNTVVGIAYTLTTPEGEILDVVKPESPLYYIHGHGFLLQKVESALEGQKEGFKVHVSLKATEAFGEYSQDLVVELPREHFPDEEIYEGMKYNTVGPDGEEIVVEVVKADEKNITVDGNHPLAGLDLEFDLELLSMREPTQEELESGVVNSAAEEKETLH